MPRADREKTVRRRARLREQSKHLDRGQPEPGRRVAMAGFAAIPLPTVGDDRGKYALDTLLKLWACLPEAVAREATKNAIDDCHEAVRKLAQATQRPRGRARGRLRRQGRRGGRRRRLGACLAQAEALADELGTEDPKKGVYRKRLDDLAQHRRAPRRRPRAACEDALGDAGDALARYKHPTDAALDRWTAHRAAEKRLRACGARRRARGERARALPARARPPERRGADIDAPDAARPRRRRRLDAAGVAAAHVVVFRRISEGEAQLPPAPAEPAEPVEPEATQTPRDPRLYDYAAARVACEEADAALAARTAKTARQRLRGMRAAALAGALPRSSTRTRRRRSRTCRTASRAAAAGRAQRGNKGGPRAAARRRGAGAAPRARTTRARTSRPRSSRPSRAAPGAHAVGDSTAAGDAAAPGPRPPPSRRRVAAGGRRGHLRPRRRQRPGRRALRRAAAAAGRAAARRGASAARQDRRAGRRHGRRGPARRRPRARRAVPREAAVPERVDARARPEAAAPPPAEAPGPAPGRWRAGRGRGQGRHARFCKVPPRRLPAVLRRRPRGRPRRPVRARVPAKWSTGGPPSRRSCGAARRRLRPRSAPRPSPPRARRWTRSEHGRGRGAGAAGPQRAGDRRGAQRREPRHGAPGPRRPAERRDFAGRTAADAAPSTRVARAVRFGSGDDAAPALDFGRERGPVRPVDWDVYVVGAARTRPAKRAYDLGAQEVIFDDGEAVPVEDCDLRAGRSALDVYEPLRAQLENQRVSSLAGALVDELAEEFVLGFRDQGRELEREAAAAERCAMSAEERATRTWLAAEARAARLEQLRLNVLAQETNFGLLSPGPRAHPAPAPAPTVYETPAPEDTVAGLEKRVAALESDGRVIANLEERIAAMESDDEAPVLAAGHEPVEPSHEEEEDPMGQLRRRGDALSARRNRIRRPGPSRFSPPASRRRGRSASARTAGTLPSRLVHV